MDFKDEISYWKTMREPPRVKLKEGYEIREDNRVHKKENQNRGREPLVTVRKI